MGKYLGKNIFITQLNSNYSHFSLTLLLSYNILSKSNLAQPLDTRYFIVDEDVDEKPGV